jgi:thioredoxin 1
VCAEYRSRFEQVQASVTADHPNAQFVWLDIEDEADLLHPLDVIDFPTLLIAVGDAPRFFGPLTPQAQTLERLVRNAANDASAATLADPEVRAAVARIRAQRLSA